VEVVRALRRLHVVTLVVEIVLDLVDVQLPVAVIVVGDANASLAPNADKRRAVRRRKTAVQPRISTVPCKSLYLVANEMLPSPMFSSQTSQSPSRSPDLSSRCSSFPSRCRRGALAPQTFPRLAFFSKLFTIRTSEKRARNTHRMRTSKTHDLKPFGIRSYGKTRGGGPSRAQASSSPLNGKRPSGSFRYLLTSLPRYFLPAHTPTPATPFLSCPYFTVLCIPRGWGSLSPLARRSPLAVRRCGIFWPLITFPFFVFSLGGGFDAIRSLVQKAGVCRGGAHRIVRKQCPAVALG